MKIINLSDSETTRDTYEKELEYSLQSPASTSILSQSELNSSKTDAHSAVAEDESSN